MAVTVILRVRTEVFIRDAPLFQLAVLENKKPALSKARAQMAKIDTETIRRLFRTESRDCARHLFLSSGLYRRFRNRTGIGLSKRLADLWHTAHYRRWGITPRPETAYLHYSAGLFCCQEKFQGALPVAGKTGQSSLPPGKFQRFLPPREKLTKFFVTEKISKVSPGAAPAPPQSRSSSAHDIGRRRVIEAVHGIGEPILPVAARLGGTLLFHHDLCEHGGRPSRVLNDQNTHFFPFSQTLFTCCYHN